jgi:hypothetical protein
LIRISSLSLHRLRAHSGGTDPAFLFDPIARSRSSFFENNESNSLAHSKDDVKRWRQRAAAIRALAATFNSDGPRAALEETAQTYDRMADELEEKLSGKKEK